MPSYVVHWSLLLGLAFTARAGLDSWQWQRPLPTGLDILGITEGQGFLVAVGHQGNILTSPDGASWTRRYSGVTNDLTHIVYAQGRFVATGTYGAIVTSTNGLHWEFGLPLTSSHLGGAAYGNGTFVSFTTGGPGQIFTSSNLLTWSAYNYTNRTTLRQVRNCNGIFIGTGAYGIVTSTNGINRMLKNV